NTAPSFSERNIRTTLLAQDGSTVVIGGIIQNRASESLGGIPGLKDLPLIAPLFSAKNNGLNRTELIIAITPHVIDQRENGSTREFLNRMRDLQKRARRGRIL
ncbi:MAG: type II and III secretion system protein, partial [Syntrophobacteraceae bacterium]|nr:type II and III secretion system protein [Syntrophobacteraceae bacterium]